MNTHHKHNNSRLRSLPPFLFALAFAFSALSCGFVENLLLDGSGAESAPVQAQSVDEDLSAELPTDDQPAPSSGLTPAEAANAGTHTYRQVTEEFQCSASDPSTREVHFTNNFSPGLVEILNLDTPSGSAEYQWVELNTYERVVTTDEATYVVTVTFSQQGFTLYSLKDYAGGATGVPCLRYTRTLADE